MKELLKDKVAIVTGGTRGIGMAIVKRFIEEGAIVILCGSREGTATKALNAVKQEYPNAQVDAIWPTLTDKEMVHENFNNIYQKYGRLDILVNNAGISQRTQFLDYTEKEYSDIMELNLKAVFICSQVTACIMKEQGYGVILNTSSIVSLYGQVSGFGYPTSKFAVNGLTKSLARELGKYHIRVNAVAPGVVKTDMVANLPKDLIQPIIDQIPLGRMAEAEDIANAFVYLASDMASYVSGEILSVDGAVVI